MTVEPRWNGDGGHDDYTCGRLEGCVSHDNPTLGHPVIEGSLYGTVGHEILCVVLAPASPSRRIRLDLGRKLLFEID